MASGGLDINVAHYVDCFTGRWEIRWGLGSPCGEGRLCGAQPFVCSSMFCLGKLGCPSQFLEWLIRTAAFPVTVCISRMILVWPLTDRWALWEGETPEPGRVVLTDGSIMIKRYTSQVWREMPPPGSREKKKEKLLRTSPCRVYDPIEG